MASTYWDEELNWYNREEAESMAAARHETEVQIGLLEEVLGGMDQLAEMVRQHCAATDDEYLRRTVLPELEGAEFDGWFGKFARDRLSKKLDALHDELYDLPDGEEETK